MLPVALYFCTAFSFSQARLWATTRFSLVVALRERWKDWREQRLRAKLQKELDKRRAAKPAIQTQMIQARAAAPVEPQRAEPRRTGIERFEEEHEERTSPASHDKPPEPVVEVTERADTSAKTKTTMPRVTAGGYKLPPSSLLHRADEQQAVDADELKLLAQVL